MTPNNPENPPVDKENLGENTDNKEIKQKEDNNKKVKEIYTKLFILNKI